MNVPLLKLIITQLVPTTVKKIWHKEWPEDTAREVTAQETLTNPVFEYIANTDSGKATCIQHALQRFSDSATISLFVKEISVIF